MTPALVTVAPSRPAPRASSALDPRARLARVAADEHARRPGSRQARTSAAPSAAHGRVIERRHARLAANAVGAEQPRPPAPASAPTAGPMDVSAANRARAPGRLHRTSSMPSGGRRAPASVVLPGAEPGQVDGRGHAVGAQRVDGGRRDAAHAPRPPCPASHVPRARPATLRRCTRTPATTRSTGAGSDRRP